MINYNTFLDKNETAQSFNNRLKVFIKLYKDYKQKRGTSLKILDIGCGKKAVLSDNIEKNDTYYGCDYYQKMDKKIDNYVNIDLNIDSLSEKLKNKKFDVIFCGEIIEHLFSPDHLLDEIKKIMHKNSILILSTPNLGYFLNRIMLLFGLSPFFIENSSEYKLGRRFRFLGQGYPTQGHIRIFTYGALKDLFSLKKLCIMKTIPTTWGGFFDSFFNLISPALSPNNVFLLKKD